MKHYSEDELTLYYYGEGRRRASVERHLQDCAACAKVYRAIAGTLAMIAAPEVPERGDQYRLEVWQRIRYRLPDREGSSFGQWFRWDRLSLAAAAAGLVLIAFLAGQTSRQPADAPPTVATQTQNAGDAGRAAGDARQRILITSVADHLDRSERVLTDIMNAPVTHAGGGDISIAQRWADDLLTTSRLYRQDAVDAGERSVATVLDDLERSLLEIVHSPSRISAADLEQIRRRIDAAALLFKVRVMSDELRQREQPAGAFVSANVNTEGQLKVMDKRHTRYSTLCFTIAAAAGLASPAGAQSARMAIAAKAATLAGPAWVEADDRADDRADDLYDRARDLIEQGKFDRAIGDLDRVIELKSSRTDAALYWKAYSLGKLGRKADALSAIADLQQKFKDSRWVKDAKALEVEVRQSSGQTVTPESQNDEELKLMALRGLMNSDADRAMPIIEQMLAGANSPKVKDRALFVLSQSNSSRARDIIGNVAKGGSNPDLQLRAIKYLGIMGGNDNRQLLADVYRASSDSAVKRSIIRSFMVSGDRTRLLGLAKSETAPELRGEAVQQLGVMGAHAELAELYSTETSADVKKRIIQAMFVGGSADKLMELAKTEKDQTLRRSAVRNLGLMGASRTGDAIKAIYQSDSSVEIKKEAINALFLQNNGRILVELARAEKDPQMKKDMVAKMSIMGKSKEVTDYLLELLK